MKGALAGTIGLVLAGASPVAVPEAPAPAYSWSHGSVSPEQRQLCQTYDAAWHDSIHPQRLYLSFDLGCESGYTLQILDALAAANVKATFFITSDYLHAEPLILERMLRDGHVVGNHSERHLSMPGIASDRRAEEELERLGRSFHWRYGRSMRYFRFPEGKYDERTLAMAQRLGYKAVFWGFAYRDWDPVPAMTPEQAVAAIVKGIEGGDVVLLHAIAPTNALALPELLRRLKERRFEFATLDDYPWQRPSAR